MAYRDEKQKQRVEAMYQQAQAIRSGSAQQASQTQSSTSRSNTSRSNSSSGLYRSDSQKQRVEAMYQQAQAIRTENREKFNKKYSSVADLVNTISSTADKYLSSYRTGDELEKYKSSYESQASEIQTQLEQLLSDYADDRESTKTLTELSRKLKELNAGVQEKLNYWGQWDTAEQYDAYKKTSEKTENGWLNDGKATTAEAAQARQGYYQENQEKIAALDEQILQLERETADVTSWMDWVQNYQNLSSGIDPVTVDIEKTTELEQLKAQKAELEEENRLYERTQKSSDDNYEIAEQLASGAATVTVPESGTDSLSIWKNATQEERAAVANRLQSQYLTDDLTYLKDSLRSLVTNGSGTDDTTVDTILRGDNQSWNQLTDTEEQVYYYILQTEGQEHADKYLDDMATTLNYRATRAMEQEVQDAGAGGDILYSAASVLTNQLGWIPAVLDEAASTLKGEEINPYNAAHYLQNYSSAARGATAEDIENAIAGDGSSELRNSIGTFASNTYQAAMSGIDSAVGGEMFGNAYTVAMGLSAASQRARELYEDGASKEEILAGSIGSGILEALFEYASLDKFTENFMEKPITGWRDFVKKALVQGGVEASEEVNTEIANQLWDAIVRGAGSEDNQQIRELMETEGLSYAQAKQEAIKENIQDVFWAGYGGFVSGGGMAAIGGVTNYAQNAKYYNEYANYDAESIINEALEINPDNKDAQYLKKRLESGKKVTGLNVAGLVEENEQALRQQDRTNIQAAAKARLQELGMEGDIDLAAQGLAKEATGESLTKKEQSAIYYSKAARQVRQELSAENIRSGGDVADWVKNIGAERLNAEEYSGEYVPRQSSSTGASAAQEQQNAAGSTQAANKTTVSKEAAQVAQQTIQEATRQLQDEPNMPQAKRQELEAKVQEAQTVATTYNQQQEKTQAKTLEERSKKYGNQAKGMMAVYQEGQNVEEYDGAFQIAYTMGQEGVSRDYAMRSVAAQTLTQEQLGLAYDLGAGAAEFDARKEAMENGTAEEGVRVRGSVQRNDGTDTGGEVRSLGRGAGSNSDGKEGSTAGGSGDGSKAQADVRKGSGKVSTRDLGIAGGTSEKNLTVISPVSNKDAREAAALAAKFGLKARFISGEDLSIIAPDGSYVYARGQVDGNNNIVVRVDHAKFSASQLMRHEIGHVQIRRGEISVEDVLSQIREQCTEEYVTWAIEEYAKAYAMAGVSPEYVFEEILCDSLAEMNAFEEESQEYAAPFLANVKTAAEQNAEARKETRGPPSGENSAEVKFSIDKGKGLELTQQEIDEGIPAVASMNSVKSITGQEFQKGETDLVTQVHQFFRSIGGKVENKQIGTITLDKRGIKSDMSHGLGRKKAAAFAAVPEVLRNGRVIDYQENWKNRRYDTAVIAAPIEVDGERYYMGAVVERQSGQNSFYLHELIAEKGTLPIKTRTYGNEASGYPSDNVPIISILDRIRNVKQENTSEQKFSMESVTERKKDLVAVHNLSVQNLERSLDLGGLPMPSIAIVKAEQGHSKFGEVSLVFRSDTIDPASSRNNKLYGGDAWTPTYPRIEYKASKQAEDRIHQKYTELSRKLGRDAAMSLYRYAYSLEDTLNSEGGEQGVMERVYDDTGLMQLYLADSGKGQVDQITKTIRKELSAEEKQFNQMFVDALGEDVIRGFQTPAGESPMTHRKQFLAEHREQILAVYAKDLQDNFGFSAEVAEESAHEDFTDKDLLKRMRETLQYLRTGGITETTTVDTAATDAAIQEKAADGYKAWADELFRGVEEKAGIRNNQDAFTYSGNRRSWEALHWENNLENVVKAMRQEEQTGKAAFGGMEIWGVAAKQYGTLNELRSDEGRLRNIPEEQYEALKENYTQRFQEIAQSIVKHSPSGNAFIENDTACENIVDAIRRAKTKSGMLRYLQQYNPAATTATVDDIMQLVNDIASMPTGYFEAKPRRAVGMEEVATAIVPDSAGQSLRSKLSSAGVNTVYYAAGDEQSRLNALNGLEDVRFSRETADQTQTEQFKRWFGDWQNKSKSINRFLLNDDGTPKRFYHGTPNGTFNTFRDWQYFTDNQAYADVYQSQGASSNGYKQTANNRRTYEVYLAPKKIFDTRKAKERRIFQNEFYQQWGNGAPLSEKGLPDWTDGDDLIEFFEEKGYDYDAMLLDEGATGGYGMEVKSRGISIVVRDSSAIKSATDNVGTFDRENADIRYSREAKQFSDDVARWNRNGRDENAPAFILGSTGEVLQGLGAIESDIYMLPAKVSTILKEHPEMTIETVQHIPDILEDPILVLKSRTVSDRLVAIGSVKAANGRPVLAVLDMHPEENHFYIDDMQKVSSAYTKTESKGRTLEEKLGYFLNHSEYLYADKKRTTQLLRAMGVQSPITLQQGGYIGSINYDERNVNLSGKKFSEVFSENSTLYSRDNPVEVELRKENDLLRRRMAYFKGQLQRTKVKSVRLSDVDKAAKAILNEYSSKADFGQVRNGMKALADYLLQTKEGDNVIDTFTADIITKEGDWEEQRWEVAQQRALTIARTVVDGSSVMTNAEEMETFGEIRAALKGTKISLRDNKADLDSLGGYNEFRKKNFGRFILSDDGVSIDSVWLSLQDQFGKGFFPDSIANPADQIAYIAELYDRFEPQYANPYQGSMGQNVEACANAILDQVYSDAIRPTAPTYADQKAEKIAAQKKEIAKLDSQLAQSRKRVKRLEQQRREIAQHYQDMRKRDSSARKESADVRKYRTRIELKAKAMMNALLKNSDKEHIPEPLKEVVADFLTSIDFSSKSLLEKGQQTQRDMSYKATLDRVRQVLQNQQNLMNGKDEDGLNDYYLDLPAGFVDQLQEHINAVDKITPKEIVDATKATMAANKSAMQTSTLYTMNAKQLEELDYFLTVLQNSVKNVNQLMANAHFQSVTEASQRTIQELNGLNRKQVTTKAAQSAETFIEWDNTTPYYAFKRMGSGAASMFEGLQDGWAKMALNVKQLLGFARKTYTGKEVRGWSNTVKQVKLSSGKEIKISIPQIMSLYCLAKRQQAQGHLYGGGIQIDAVELEMQLKAKNGQERRFTRKIIPISSDDYTLTPDDVMNMTALLSERQMEVADALQKYMNTVGSAWGNEVSMRRFGYRAFTEENYFPITASKHNQETNSADTQNSNDLYRLLNLSMTKSLNEHANNAILISSIFDVFADHMSDMAKYNGLALPVLDAVKWFNFRNTEHIGDGSQIETQTVQKSLEGAFGGNASKYIIGLLKDINGIRDGGKNTDGFARKMISNYKVAAVASNLRVALLQPTAYVRASAVIDPNYLARGLITNPAKAADEAEQYSGIAAWKSMGFYDTSIARGVRDQIKDKATWKERFVETTMKGAELGDRMTWGVLWNACKLEVKEKQGLSGEELLKATAKRFEEVVYKTQVVDSTLTRSQAMRDSGGLATLSTAFMAEPTLSYNMLLDAYTEYSDEVRRTGKRGKAFGKFKKRIFRTLCAYSVTGLASAVAESVMDALRDTDDYETLLEKFAEAFPDNLLDDLNPFSNLPVIKDAISIFSGFSNDRMDTAWIGSAQAAWEAWTDTTGKYTTYGKIYKSLKALSQFTGTPISNISRGVATIWNNTFGVLTGNKLKTYDPGPKTNIKYAYLDGYLTEEEATQELLEQGLEDDANDAYFTIRKWDGGEDYTKFGELEDAIAQGGSIDAELEVLTSHGYTQKEAESHVKSGIGNLYIEGRITAAEAKERLKKYLGMETDEIETTVAKWGSKAETGVSYSEIKDEYISGSLSAEEAEEMQQKYGGLTAAEASAKVAFWDYERDNPDVDVESGWADKYADGISAAGISAETYIRYRTQTQGISGKGKKEAILKIIDSLNLSSDQKDALYLSEGWAEKKLSEAPWH